MEIWKIGKMIEQGFVSIDNLQQKEVRRIGRAAGPAANPRRQGFTPLLQKTLQFTDVSGEPRSVSAIERRGNERAVEYYRVVVANFYDPDYAEAGVV